MKYHELHGSCEIKRKKTSSRLRESILEILSWTQVSSKMEIDNKILLNLKRTRKAILHLKALSKILSFAFSKYLIRRWLSTLLFVLSTAFSSFGLAFSFAPFNLFAWIRFLWFLLLWLLFLRLLRLLSTATASAFYGEDNNTKATYYKLQEYYYVNWKANTGSLKICNLFIDFFAQTWWEIWNDFWSIKLKLFVFPIIVKMKTPLHYS